MHLDNMITPWLLHGLHFPLLYCINGSSKDLKFSVYNTLYESCPSTDVIFKND